MPISLLNFVLSAEEATKINSVVQSFEMSSCTLEIPTSINRNRVKTQIKEVLEVKPYSLNLKKLYLKPLLAHSFVTDISCLLNSHFYKIKEYLNPRSSTNNHANTASFILEPQNILRRWIDISTYCTWSWFTGRYTVWFVFLALQFGISLRCLILSL